MGFTRQKCPRSWGPTCVSKPPTVLLLGHAMTPAFAMIRSKGLLAASNPSAQRRTLSSEARSSWTKSKEPPFAACARTCSVAARALDRSRAAPTTCAPCAASARAVSTPRPAETPVTNTRFPLKLTPCNTSSVVEVAPKDLGMVKILTAICNPYRWTPQKWSNRKWRAPPLNIRRHPPFGKCYVRSRPIIVKRNPTAPERKPRAAKAGFSGVGLDVSLEEIARRAGVGIGTLYRHFPSREAVVEAVYRREVEQLAEAVPQLLGTSPAA